MLLPVPSRSITFGVGARSALVVTFRRVAIPSLSREVVDTSAIIYPDDNILRTSHFCVSVR